MILYPFSLLLFFPFVFSAPLQKEGISVTPATVPYVKVHDEFLEMTKNWPKEAKEEFNGLLGITNLTRTEVDKRMEETAEKYGYSEQWSAYFSRWNAKLLKFYEKTMEISTRLPIVYEQAYKIYTNHTSTILEISNASSLWAAEHPTELRPISFLQDLFINDEEELMTGRIESLFSKIGNDSEAKEELPVFLFSSNLTEKKRKQKELIKKYENLLESPVRYVTVEEELRNFSTTWTKEAKEELFKIKQRSDWTHAEQDQKFNEWAEKYGYSDRWSAYDAKLTATQSKLLKKMRKIFNNLPSVAQELSKIQMNRNLTYQESDVATAQLLLNNFWESVVIVFLGYEFRDNEEAIMTENQMNSLEFKKTKNGRKMRDFMVNQWNWRGILVPGIME